MRLKTVAVLIFFIITNICSAWAGQYSFSGYGRRMLGIVDKSCMCTVSFSVDESSPMGEVGATFRFINTGNVPIQGAPFSSDKVEIISKDGKTYVVSWYSGKVELKDGRIFEIPGKVNSEKVKDIVTNHPELQKPSSFEELTAPLKDESEEASRKESIRLINPGGTVEKILYNNDPLIRTVITSQNVDSVVFYSGMGKFILRKQ